MDLTETSIPGTDDWWVMELASDFGRELPRLHRLKAYSDGTNALPEETDQAMRDAYRRFIHSSRLNLADTIVSTKVSRMRPLGFRTAAPGDVNGDAAAWATWKRSGLKVGARDFFRDAGIYGSAFLTTTGPQVPSSSAEPLIIASNGFSTVTRQNVLRPWLADAALQVGHDAINGVDLLTLFRPGYMRMAMRTAKKSSIPTNGKKWLPGRGWSWVSDPVALGYTSDVPVFRMSGPDGMGMFEKHLDTLDRVTIGIRDRLTISAMQAFIQRGIQSDDLPQTYPDDHPLAGQQIDYNEVFKAGPAALWLLPAGAKMFEGKVADITPLLKAGQDDIKTLAGVSSTPLFILSPENASAEGAKSGSEAFATSVEEWIERADMPLALAQSTAFQAQGDAVRSVVGEIETIWALVDRSSLAEKSQAAANAKAGGMPQRMIDEKIWGLSPAEIAQARQDRSDEQFELAAP